MSTKVIKVIHVHFIHSRKNFYFGSVSAIFEKFSEREVGCTLEYLRHVLVADGSKHISDRCFFQRSHLIQLKRSKGG